MKTLLLTLALALAAVAHAEDGDVLPVKCFSRAYLAKHLRPRDLLTLAKGNEDARYLCGSLLCNKHCKFLVVTYTDASR